MRKVCGLFLLLVLMMFVNISMADTTIDKKDIIIQEPLTENVYSDKSLFVTINITNPDVYLTLSEKPLSVELIKIEDAIPFASELGTDLQVPLTRITSSHVGTVTESSEHDASEYANETEIINEYFKQLDAISALNNEINAINNKYKFASKVKSDADLITMSVEERSDYSEYVKNLQTLSELRKEFSAIQSQYLKLFEVTIADDQIVAPSFIKDVGKLEVGNYKLRIESYEDELIKEYKFKVLEREEAIKSMMVIPGSVDENVK